MSRVSAVDGQDQPAVAAKQIIYSRLMHEGFVYFRNWEGWAANASWWSLRRERRVFRHGHALADLLHNMDHSILDPEFEENDLSFVNIAIPIYLRRVDPDFDSQILSLLIAFYDAVPLAWRSRLTWHPSEELRSRVRARAETVG